MSEVKRYTESCMEGGVVESESKRMSSKIEETRARLSEIANRDSAVSVTVRAEDLRTLLAAPVVERQLNQCDGCRAGIPLEDGNLHAIVNAGGYRDVMSCTAHLYAAPVVERQPDPIIGVLKSNLADRVMPSFSGGDLKHLIRLLETPPELAELQATIARLESEAVYAAAGFQAAKEEIARLTAENERLKGEALSDRHEAWMAGAEIGREEIERLKGGQGEVTPAMEDAGCQAYMDADGMIGIMHKSSMGHAYRAMRSLEQPAPVSVVIPERKNERPFGDATTSAEYNEAKGFNRAIDKVKELNQ